MVLRSRLMIDAQQEPTSGSAMLRAFRLATGQGAAALATAAQSSRTMIIALERGSRSPSRSLLFAIAHALHLTHAELGTLFAAWGYSPPGSTLDKIYATLVLDRDLSAAAKAKVFALTKNAYMAALSRNADTLPPAL